MVVAYFDPDTAENPALRQTLSYFLPVYSHSRYDNQYRMQSILLSALEMLINRYAGVEIADDMVSPAIFTSVLVDWTDPRKNVSFAAAGKRMNGEVPEAETIVRAAHHGHLEIASEALSRCVEKGCSSKYQIALQ